MATTIKAVAVRWLASRFGGKSNTVYASKFYIPEKSWTRRSAWWLEVPQRAIETPKANGIALAARAHPPKMVDLTSTACPK